MSDHQVILCECGKRANGEYYVWNGKDHVHVCMDCWHSPECIATEACVAYAEGAQVRADTPMTLEECVRVECGFRERPWTPELQAFVDRCYLAWYMED